MHNFPLNPYIVQTGCAPILFILIITIAVIMNINIIIVIIVVNVRMCVRVFA